MKEREKEIEEDILDRQKEKDELEELRKKLVEEGHPDPEGEVERVSDFVFGGGISIDKRYTVLYGCTGFVLFNVFFISYVIKIF